MDDKRKCGCIIAAIVGLVVVVFSLGMFHLWNQRTKIFVDAHYTRATLRGEAEATWVLDSNSTK